MKETKSQNFISCLMQHCAASNSCRFVSPLLLSALVAEQWFNMFNTNFLPFDLLSTVICMLLLFILTEGIYKIIRGKPVEKKKTEKYKTFCKEQLTLFFSWFGLVLICQHYMPEGIENKTILYGGPCVIMLIIFSTVKYYK